MPLQNKMSVPSRSSHASLPLGVEIRSIRRSGEVCAKHVGRATAGHDSTALDFQPKSSIFWQRQEPVRSPRGGRNLDQIELAAGPVFDIRLGNRIIKVSIFANRADPFGSAQRFSQCSRQCTDVRGTPGSAPPA
jgi:hypothetical protein